MVFLDEREHLLQNQTASVATLRHRSPSARNAVRVPPGIGVRLRRNRHFASNPADAADAKGKTLSKKDLYNLIAHASTRADHERLAQHFDVEAAKYEADAKDHSDRAGIYQNSQAVYQNAQMFSHCDDLGKSLNPASQNARALAAEHRKMASQAKK